MRTVSRRELARLLAALPAAQAGVPNARTLRVGVEALPLAAEAPQSSGYIGPLTGITKDVADRGFDPVAFTRDRYAAAPRANVRTVRTVPRVRTVLTQEGPQARQSRHSWHASTVRTLGTVRTVRTLLFREHRELQPREGYLQRVRSGRAR